MDFERWVRQVDNALVWDKKFKNHIWHVMEFLEFRENNGITQNSSKFVFGQKEVEFIGCQLTEDSFAPAPAIVISIREFPRPQNISWVWEWFGIVEQVYFAFKKTREIEAFRELLSSKKEFSWNKTL